MSTHNRLDFQTQGSQPVMPKNLPNHWTPLKIYACPTRFWNIIALAFLFFILAQIENSIAKLVQNTTNLGKPA